VGVALALLAALAFGVSDFAAGVASRRVSAGQVTAVAQALGVLTAIVGVIVFSGSGPAAPALGWGALSGVGSAVGTLSLYRGLATGRMTIVATLSAVLTAVIPALVGIALGNDISALALTGIVLSLPAIALVSWQPDTMTAGTPAERDTGCSRALDSRCCSLPWTARAHTQEHGHCCPDNSSPSC
jgi:uncharacterized membrane protein